MWIYLLFAFGVLPAYVPAAIARLEPDPVRARAMRHLALIGAAVSLVLVAAMVRGPVEASIGGRYIAYEISLSHGGLIVAAYVAATCGALLASSYRLVVRFGMVNLVAVGVLFWLNTTGFASLWCAWAAMASLGIALRIRSGHSSRSPGARANSRRGDVRIPSSTWPFGPVDPPKGMMNVLSLWESSRAKRRG